MITLVKIISFLFFLGIGIVVAFKIVTFILGIIVMFISKMFDN